MRADKKIPYIDDEGNIVMENRILVNYLNLINPIGNELTDQELLDFHKERFDYYQKIANKYNLPASNGWDHVLPEKDKHVYKYMTDVKR